MQLGGHFCDSSAVILELDIADYNLLSESVTPFSILLQLRDQTEANCVHN